MEVLSYIDNFEIPSVWSCSKSDAIVARITEMYHDQTWDNNNTYKHKYKLKNRYRYKVQIKLKMQIQIQSQIQI